MKEVIEKLLDVQEVDARILRLQAKLDAGPRELSDIEVDLASHRGAFEEITRKAKEAMRAGERKNADLEAIEKKIQDLQGKQMTARSNKEYEALKHEIAGHRADFEILEEEALQQWSVGEEREQEAAAEAKEIEALEARLEETKKEWEAEVDGLESEMATLKTERAERIRGTKASWINIYERVLESRGVPAVVEVVDSYCQGCQMHITVHDVTRAINGAEVVQCRACNRILYAETL